MISVNKKISSKYNDINKINEECYYRLSQGKNIKDLLHLKPIKHITNNNYNNNEFSEQINCMLYK